MEENKKRKNTKKQRQKEGKGKFEQCAWIGDNKSWTRREYSLLGPTEKYHFKTKGTYL